MSAPSERNPFEIFVRRPVFTAVLSLLLLLFGLVSLDRLSVRETPNVQAPIVTVSTVWFGADAALMETDVTEVLERQLNGIEGVRTLSSTSSEQTSTITVEFVLERDLEEAANDVRSRVSRARRDLPPDVEEPVVEKADADASPVLFMRLDAEHKDLLELSEIADTLVRERLQTVPGVSTVSIYGEQVPAVRVDLDPDRLAARGLTAQDVETALAQNNVNAPAGRVEGRATELSVRLEGDLRSADEFRDLVVAERNGSLVRLGDLGTVRAGAENERTAARSDGKPTVTVAVVPQAQANIIEISDEVQRRMPGIQQDLPAGVTITIGYDRSNAVRNSIAEVEETIFIAFGLVVLVIFAFLRDWRSTLVPALAIPVSIVGTLTFVWAAGFTINVFTLFGLVLAIGLVVDDAIVVLENVFRHIEEGKDPHRAAVDGTGQIAFAVIATTIALVAVFIPIIFTGGTSGRLFLEFGATVAVSVLISGFVALTLTPMLCSRLLKAESQHRRGAFFRVTGSALDAMNRAFARTLGWFVRWPVLALAVLVATLGIGAVSYRAVPQEFFPLEDRNLVFVRTLAAEGTSFEYMDARMRELEPELIAAVPERTSVLTRVGSGPGGIGAAANSGMFIIPLVPKDERERSQNEILGSVRKSLGGVTAFLAIPIQPTTVGRGFGAPLQFVLQHPDFDTLAAELPKFVSGMRKIEGLSAINPDLKLNRPEVVLRIDRDKAATAGVAIRDIGRTLQLLSGGREVSQYKKGSRQYPVIVQLGRDDRATPGDLTRLQVRTRDGEMVTLSNLLAHEERSAAAARFHYDRSPSATISANLEGITLGEALAQVEELARSTLPAGFRTALAGESKEFAESSAALSLVLLLALAIVYLVLAAQFDSFSDPISILVSVPLALAGAFASLWITGTTLSFFSQVGLILLVGLVTKNGILIVEYAKQLREEDPDLDPWTAASEAARLRFRPILMTSVATIGGAVPIALGFTSESRAPLGVVVVGGMAVATVLSLYVTPVVYAIVARLFQSRARAVPALAKALPLVIAAVAAAEARAEELSLEQALAIAAGDNLTVRATDLEAASVEAATGQARAALLPQVTATADAYTGVDPRFRYGEAGGVTMIASGRITVPLLDLSAIHALIARSAAADAAVAGADAVEEAVLADVAARFVELQRAEQAVATAEMNVARSERLAGLAADRVEVGLAAPIDATRAQVQMYQDRQVLVAARTDLEAARLWLAEALGRPIAAGVDVEPAAPLISAAEIPAPESLDAALATALEAHPEVVAARESAHAADATRRAAGSGWVPTVDAYAQAGLYQAPGSEALASQQLGVTATVPLFAGTGRISTIRQTRLLAEAAAIDTEQTARSIEVELRVALQVLRDGAAALEVASATASLAEAEVAQAEDRFATGLTDNTPVVEAQARLAQASLTQVNTVAAYNLAVIGWMQAQGRLHELARG